MARGRPSPAIAVALILALSWAVPVASLAADRPAGSTPVRSDGELRERVDDALDAVREARSEIGKPGRAESLSEEVGALLPGGARLSGTDGKVVQADPALPQILSRLSRASGKTAQTTCGELEAHLVSLRDALGREGKGPPSDPAALAALLATQRGAEDEAGSSLLTEWFGKLLEAISEWLGNLPAISGPRGVGIWPVVAAVVIGAVLVWVLVLAVRALRGRLPRRRRRGAVEADVSVVEAAEGLPDDVLSFAERLAEKGAFRDAMRALFGGAARSLGALGLVTRTRTRTNGELLEELAPTAPDVETALRPLSDGFELAWYGHVDPGGDGFARARRQYEAVLSAAERRASATGVE